MKHISVQSFQEIINAERNNDSVDFINVCTPTEYREKHIEGVRNVPLDALAVHLGDFVSKKTVYVHCRSGNRSQRAIETLERLGVTAELVNVEGGLMAWEGAKLSTRSFSKRLPLMQQTLLAAGSLVTLGVLLSAFAHPGFVLLSLGVGLGLMFAGSTGWCGMSMLLEKMPWNRVTK